jgi:16S rRNA (guanine527-N7)-methyltransferase
MVTRETLLREGLVALGLRPTDEDISRLDVFVDLLQNQAMELGFLGPNEGSRVITRHVLESAALAKQVARGHAIVDVGSGAGLPGLVLAGLGFSTTLIEAQNRRAEFLRRASQRMEVGTVVLNARAEDIGQGAFRESFGSAVARALAAPAVAMELSLPLVAVGGTFLLLASPQDGPGVPAPQQGGESRPLSARVPERDRRAGGPEASGDEALTTVSRMLGGGDVRWDRFQVPGVDETRWVMIVDKLQPSPARFPRRSGVPKRRPLGGGVTSVN